MSETYPLKVITYAQRRVAIITQNENGPCPFIAICNILLLRGDIVIPLDLKDITFGQLVNLAADFLCTSLRGRVSGGDLDVQKTVDDVLDALPGLQTGMDVNVRFRAVDDYEFCPAMVCFDAFNLRMVHGWLLDPAEQTFADVIGKKSYNDLMDILITRAGVQEKQVSRAEAASAGTEQEPPTAAELAEEDRTLRAAAVVDSFLSDTAGQLTYTGLISLAEQVREGELLVLFRNNHFSTLTKHESRLYCLLTDVGYADVPGAVWELLAAIDGDMHLVDHRFLAPENLGRQGQVMRGMEQQRREQQPQQPQPSAAERQAMDDASLAMALRLQEEEEAEAAERERMRRVRQERARRDQEARQAAARRAQRPPPKRAGAPPVRPAQQPRRQESKSTCIVS
eukprot:TRINITY_DN8786_c1_g1_i1.p1 TRINITY_DN8786_c1_g1~~TRINITY_DN8786_c1_g1_i1.p1  ORF type:complete len:435 (+),score=112.40 TRINITY_DN8786_c1_g1_i1:115-1305(+)